MSVLVLCVGLASGAVIDVDSVDGLRSAVATAEAGDEILLAPGTYRLDAPIDVLRSGREGAPVVLRARIPDETLLEVDQLEGFRIGAAWWVFADLRFRGICTDHSRCEHALHLAGDADDVVIRSSEFVNFNAQIKSNQGGGAFPDRVIVEGNHFYNEAPRQTANPVTPIDVVGGQGWIVRGNHIHDFAKGGGNRISYAAFLKGNGRDGRFENNLVVCELLHSGSTRLGLSLGGGGSAPDNICEGSDCSVEHTNGRIVNNIIANCPADVGIYLNSARDTQVLHNLLFDTTGIDARFEHTSVFLDGNILDGRIRERDGGQVAVAANLESYQGFEQTFADPWAGDFSVVEPADLVDGGSEPVAVDFCWNARSGAPDMGPIESDCDTTRAHLQAEEGPRDDDGLSEQEQEQEQEQEGGEEPCPEGGCSVIPVGGGVPIVAVLAGLLTRRRRSSALLAGLVLGGCSDYELITDSPEEALPSDPPVVETGELAMPDIPGAELVWPEQPEEMEPCEGEVARRIVEVSFPSTAGCRWTEDDNLEPLDGLIRAREVQRVDFAVDTDLVCDVRFAFDERYGGLDFSIQYDDQLLFAVNDRVVFASHQRLVGDLPTDSDGYRVVDWSPIRDLEMPFVADPFSIGVGNTIVLPNHDTPGDARLEIDGDALADLSARALSEASLELTLWSFGDNDPTDCGHTGFDLWVEVDLAVTD